MPAPDRPLETATELLRDRAKQAPTDIATFHRAPSGDWAPTTWSALWQHVQQTACAFGRLGLAPHARLAILARTCREWQIAELGGMLAGAAIVGVDPNASSEQVGWILEQGGVSALVVDTSANLAKVPAAIRRRLAFIIVLDSAGAASESPNTLTWLEVHTSDAVPGVDPGGEPGHPRADDPAIVIYTSGTTGSPKGIEYSHRQLMIACHACIDEFQDLATPNRFICWLPMAPLFQRMLNLVAFAGGSVTYFVEDPREIMRVVAEVRPTVFASVPRFYEKLHDGIQQRLSRLSGARKRLVAAALAAGADRSRCERSGGTPGLALRCRHMVLDRLVLRQLRAVMGGDIRWMLSGSAAAPVWLLEFFHSIGLLVLEAYGITENPVPIAANRPNAFRFGAVGRPFTSNAVRLAADGEVLVKGPAMFHGYLGEGLPSDRMTEDGYYRTGDLGRLDTEGFLYLTGRATEIIKTSTGRRISPVAVEGVYRQSPYIDQIVVVGNNRPYLVALIAANGSSSSNDAIVDLIDQDLAGLGSTMSPHERVGAFTLLQAPLSVETGELTANLKPRRDRIEGQYADLIDRMYQPGGDIPRGRRCRRSREPAMNDAPR